MKIVSKFIMVLVAGLFAANLAVAGKKEVPPFIDGTTRVSAEELIALVEDEPDLVIVDSRKRSDFQQGYIEGAVSLPNTETDAATLAKLLPSKAHPVLFYCNGIMCGRSVKAAEIAIANGYTKIYWFRGGMEEWEAKGLPVVRP